MTTAKKNFKKFYFTGGEHDKGGNMAKGITVISLIKFLIKPTLTELCLELVLIYY